MVKKDTNGWLIHFGIDKNDIINPDGWDRSNLDSSFDELITLEEFESRIRASTLKSSPAVNNFLYRKK